MNTVGTREEVVAALNELAEGWWHLAKDRNALEAHEAAEAVADGQDSVRVGHSVYEVTEDTLEG